MCGVRRLAKRTRRVTLGYIENEALSGQPKRISFPVSQIVPKLRKHARLGGVCNFEKEKKPTLSIASIGPLARLWQAKSYRKRICGSDRKAGLCLTRSLSFLAPALHLTVKALHTPDLALLQPLRNCTGGETKLQKMLSPHPATSDSSEKTKAGTIRAWPRESWRSARCERALASPGNQRCHIPRETPNSDTQKRVPDISDSQPISCSDA